MKRGWMLMVLAVVFIVTLGSRLIGEDKKTLILGIDRSGMSNEQAGQIKTIIAASFEILSKKHDFKTIIRLFDDKYDFLKAIDDKAIDFALTKTFYSVFIEKHDYLPFVQIMFYGKTSDAECIYIKNKSPIKDLEGLRDKNILTYSDLFSYYVLRKLIGERPELYFKTTTKTPNGISAIYSLSMDQTDAVFISNINIDFLKKNNPGPVKNVRTLICSDKIPMTPIFYSNSVSTNDANVIRNFFLGIRKEKAMNKYWPLMDTLRFEFIDAEKEDYDMVKKLNKEAYKNGWDKDYEYWIKTVKVEGK
jgi:ABC-type phosphate/phosphonate transport system substrate-binding protein